MKNVMRSKMAWLVLVSLLGVLVLISAAQTRPAGTQKHKPVLVTRLYTGPDGQTHAEEIEAKFTPTTTNEIFALMKISGAELRRASPGTVNDWHNAPRRQYVITLSGRGEIELVGGKKIALEPGHIELAEDITGKGHITRVVGTEDLVTLALPLSDQSAR